MAGRAKVAGWLVLVALGCSGESLSPKDEPQHPIVGRSFRLHSGYDPVEGTTPGMVFGAENFWFHAGCNSYQYDYAIENERLMVSGGGSTLLGCEPDVSAQNTYFYSFFLSDPGLTLAGEWLTLTGKSATLTFVESVPEPDRPLTGHTWRVDSLMMGSVATAFEGLDASVSFDDNGTVSVNAGCNQGQGTYEASASQLTFGPMAYTEMACSPQLVMDAEAHMQKVFAPGVATYEIGATRLIVERADGNGVVAFAE